MRAKSASITPQFMALKQLEIQEEWIKKWKGDVPSTTLGSGSNVLYGLNSK
jgi:hypothetical protein